MKHQLFAAASAAILALAVACELGGQEEVAESLYRICAVTDANYVTPAGFGLARIRAAQGDLTGSLAALELIPQTSRGYLESQKLTTEHLIALGKDAAHLAEALRVLQHARLDQVSHLKFEADIHSRALALASNGAVKLGATTYTERDLRDKLESCYRRLAQLSADAEERAEEELVTADWQGEEVLDAARRLMPGGAIYFSMAQADVDRVLAEATVQTGDPVGLVRASR